MTDSLYASGPTHGANWPNDPPSTTWNQYCPWYGKTGYTGIAQCKSWEDPTKPHIGDGTVTALTRRHGYMRGHSVSHVGGCGVVITDFWAGQKVWFCTPYNTNHTATIAAAIVHDPLDPACYPGPDYTIFLFTDDLPDTITPLLVKGSRPPYYAVEFHPCQHGRMSANVPPFYLWPSAPITSHNYIPPDTSFPPFNYADHSTQVGGDSGCPNVVLTSDNKLVFVDGRTTWAPSVHPMQDDMDTLCNAFDLKKGDYQMSWYTGY